MALNRLGIWLISLRQRGLGRRLNLERSRQKDKTSKKESQEVGIDWAQFYGRLTMARLVTFERQLLKCRSETERRQRREKFVGFSARVTKKNGRWRVTTVRASRSRVTDWRNSRSVILTVRCVFSEFDAARIDDVVKRRPPGTRVVFRAGAEQVPAARHALVSAALAKFVVLVGERPALSITSKK